MARCATASTWTGQRKIRDETVPRNAQNLMIEGSLEVKLPTIWTNERQSWEESEKKKKEDQKRESLRRKKIQVREKVGKSRNTVFFQWSVAPEGRKVGSLKRRLRSHLARWLMKNCTRCGAKHISKRICKDAFSVAGAVQETCSSEMSGGQGADFLRKVAFWSIKSSGLPRWFCMTGAALRNTGHHFFEAQYFRQMEWKNRKTHWYEAVSSALNFPLLKEVSQNCFVFYVVNFRNWRSLAELFRFWSCQIQKLRKSRRIAAFLTLSRSKTEKVSQNSFVFKLAER